ncbi:hypothetical protein [Nannocystis radixulma]|uniref:Myxococcus cysteine-rich repeat-containing protein n=1 Tax=Nannocystis radixulma TaxID=2995305 RepID=A0ABT5AWA8_9BACT|nr:hypothetical protein [Nannocystis radixulma]MDC0666121.1 hypothetical protein [Nannocystis radixulma]
MSAILRPVFAGRRTPHAFAALAVLSACFYQPTVSQGATDATSTVAVTDTSGLTGPSGATSPGTTLPTTGTTSAATTDVVTITGPETTTGVSGVCGDGAVEGVEECDDANEIAADGCESDCRTTRILDVAAGTDTTCVVLEGGYLKCWGNNGRGRLGYGHTETIGDDEPASAAGILDVGGKVLKVAPGLVHTCVLLEGGSVRCWGYGKDGRLGTGSFPLAACLDGQQNIQCELDPACCIGDDEHPGAIPPVDVGGPVDDIVVGEEHTCVLLTDGKVRCWGDNYLGELGLGFPATIGDDEVPSTADPVSLGDQAIRLFGGSLDTCAVLQAGAVRCWGGNQGWHLGVPETQPVGDDELPSSLPPMPLGGPLIALTLADETTCAWLQGNRVQCWGKSGTLGIGSTDIYAFDDLPPPDIDVGGEVAAIGAGDSRACVHLNDGTVRCWGYGFGGSLGYGDIQGVGDEPGEMPPPPVDLGGTPVRLSIGRVHACALLADNRLKCWGYNSDGQLGYGHTNDVGDEPGEMPPPDVPLFE